MPLKKKPTKATKPTKVTNRRLKSYLDATKNESLLLGEVDRYLQLLSNDRDQTHIHASEMAKPDWCPRATWLRLSGKVPPVPESLRLRTGLIFAEGRAIHEKWQGWFQGMGILWGDWKCLRCLEVRVNCWSKDLALGDPCWDGGAHYWKYQEVPLTHSQFPLLVGTSDGVVLSSTGEEVMLEIKSIGPGTMRHLGLMEEGDDPDDTSNFSRITRPMKSHRLQTQIYLRMGNNSMVRKPKRAVILYEHKADQRAREFVITYSPEQTDHLFDIVADIQWALDKGREIKCPHGGCKQCG